MANIPDRIPHASRTQFSVARYYGGCTVNGQEYIYDYDTDTLIRKGSITKKEITKLEKRKAELIRDAMAQEENPDE